MVRSFYNGVSGVKTQNFGMDVWANNISNINNIGFSASIPEFKSIFYQSVYAAGNTPTRDQAGLGASGQTTAISFYKQGAMMITDNRLDMAIQGDGFFGVLDRSGERLYTRKGSFGVDKEGFLVDNNGRYVTGVQNPLQKVSPSKNAVEIFGKTHSLTPYLDAYTLAEVSDLDIGVENSQGRIKLPDFLYLPPEVTSKISYRGNLNSSVIKEQTELEIDEEGYESEVDNATRRIKFQGKIEANATILEPKKGDMIRVNLSDKNGISTSFIGSLDENGDWQIDELLPANFDLSDIKAKASITSVQEKPNKEKFVTELYASNGEKNKLVIDFTKQIPQGRDRTIWSADARVLSPDNQILSSSRGEFVFGETGALISHNLGTLSNQGTPLDINFGTHTPNGYTGITSTPNQKTLSVSKNGLAEGILKEYFTNNSGNILASFTNGKSIAVGKVAIYHFQNKQGLHKMGDSTYAQSANSGEALFYKNKEGKTIYGAKVASSTLEQSNVNLAQALTEVIAIQKAFDANAKSITTSDEMIKTAINLRR